MKILAVDDDPTFRELLSLMLREMGQEDVTLASSGGQCLEVIAHAPKPFGCFLLDIQMPGMSGIEVCSAIRTFASYRQTPIIMITSMSAKSFVDAAFMAGATDYLTKPLDRLEMRARIGMAERLHEEQVRNAALANQAAAKSFAPKLRVDFEAPMLIPGVKNCIEYLALENYLLTLGFSRQIGLAAFCIHIENAASIFSAAGPSVFVDMLKDVATVISDETKADQRMFTYAGAGDFVVLVSRLAAHETQDLELAINIALMDFENIYAAEGVPTPTVVVSDLVRGSIAALGNPAMILNKAIALARSSQNSRQRIGRFVS